MGKHFARFRPNSTFFSTLRFSRNPLFIGIQRHSATFPCSPVGILGGFGEGGESQGVRDILRLSFNIAGKLLLINLPFFGLFRGANWERKVKPIVCIYYFSIFNKTLFQGIDIIVFICELLLKCKN